MGVLRVMDLVWKFPIFRFGEIWGDEDIYEHDGIKNGDLSHFLFFDVF